MRLPRLRDLARAITRWLPQYRAQKDLVGGCDSDWAVEGVDRQQITLFPECLED
jgi:adenylate kinase family enzyme